MSEDYADASRYYDEFSRQYDQRRSEGYHALIDDIEASFVPGTAGRCLEVGCGTGLILDRLKDRIPHRVGLDLSFGMLQHARRRGHLAVQGSVEALPFANDMFACLYSFKVLAHVRDIRRGMAEMARVVQPGGYLVLEFYNRRSLRGLRWRLKLLMGGERTSRIARETDLFTRYDDLMSILSYLPPGTRLETVRGTIIFTPLAHALKIPVLGSVLSRLERRCSRGPLARYAGFVTVVLRRD